MVDSLGYIPDFLKDIDLKQARDKSEVKKPRIQMR